MRFQDNEINNKTISRLETIINNDVFRIRIRTKDNRSIEDIETYGTYVSGIKSIDMNAGNEMINIFLSIEMMITYFERGSPFYIYSKEDISRIYTTLNDYVKTWKVKIQSSLHNENPPLDKLLKYENFANVIFAYAKYDFTRPQEISSKFLSTLNGNSLFSPNNSLRRVSFTEEKDKDDLPERETLDTFFKSRKIPKIKSYR